MSDKKTKIEILDKEEDKQDKMRHAFDVAQEQKKYNVPTTLPESGVDLLDSESGFIVGARGFATMQIETDKHMITIANTGGGKGRAVAIPNMLNHNGSLFSIEIGGTGYKQTHNYRRSVLGQDVHLIDPLGAIKGEKSACFNVLDTVDPHDPRFITEMKQIADSLLKHPKGKEPNDPYFENTPRELLLSLLIHVKTSDSISDEDRHLPKVAELIASYGSEEWDELMHAFASDTGRYRASFNKAGNYFHGVNDENTRSIISSISNSALSFVEDPAFAEILKTSSFDLNNFREKKTSLYIVLPEIEDFKTNSAFFRMLTERAFVACPNLGDGGRSFTHDDRALFMLDEFTQLGKLDVIDTGMQTARQKGITIWALFQDIGRLEALYGKEIAGSFLGAAGVVQVFDVGDERTKEYVSNRVGNNLVMIPTVQHSITDTDGKNTTWSEAISLGTNRSQSKAHTTGTSETWSTAIGESTAFTKTSGYQGGQNGGHNWSNSRTDTYSRTDTKGGGRSNSDTDTNTEGTSEQNTNTQGGGASSQRGETYSVSFTPQKMPKMEPAEVENYLGTDNQQIIFVRSQGQVRYLLDFRSNYDQIPYLNARAYGPGDDVFPAPLFLPPQHTKLLPSPRKALQMAANVFVVERPEKVTVKPFSKIANGAQITVPDSNEVVTYKENRRTGVGTNLRQRIKIRAMNFWGSQIDTTGKGDKARKSLGINNDIEALRSYVRTEYLAAMAYQGYCRESYAPSWNSYSFQVNRIKERQRHLNALKSQTESEESSLETLEGNLDSYRSHIDSYFRTDTKGTADAYARKLTALVALKEQWPEMRTPTQPNEKDIDDNAPDLDKDHIRGVLSERSRISQPVSIPKLGSSLLEVHRDPASSPKVSDYVAKNASMDLDKKDHKNRIAAHYTDVLTTLEDDYRNVRHFVENPQLEDGRIRRGFDELEKFNEALDSFERSLNRTVERLREKRERLEAQQRILIEVDKAVLVMKKEEYNDFLAQPVWKQLEDAGTSPLPRDKSVVPAELSEDARDVFRKRIPKPKM